MDQRESPKFSARDRAWLSWRELVALVVFLALLGGLVLWTTTALPVPAAELKVELFVPAAPSSSPRASRSFADGEAP
jgi:hypothetical protein